MTGLRPSDDEIEHFVLTITSEPEAIVAYALAIGPWRPSGQRMEMTMTSTTSANAELENRPLEAHELDIVSGGGISAQQPTIDGYLGARGDFGAYETWSILEPVRSPLNVAGWVGKFGGII